MIRSAWKVFLFDMFEHDAEEASGDNAIQPWLLRSFELCTGPCKRAENII